MNLIAVQKALRVALVLILCLMAAWAAWMGTLFLLTGGDWR